jgi:GNAT superfamily N-acetyltransferase
MSARLDIHAASPEEQAAAHRNVHDIWSKGLPPAEHVAARLASPKHRLATWYVGTLEGRVVVSLGAYPLRFVLRGERLRGFAIGSVYTVPDCRGHRYAPQLIEWVEREQWKHGSALSILYSDIDPAYYAYRGYILCPSLAGWRDPRDDNAAPADRLVELAPAEHLSELMRLYDAYHGALPLSIARNESYWQALLARFADDRFYALRHGDAWLGYIRLACRTPEWRITDFALADHTPALAERMYRAALELARAKGAERFGGWLPDNAAARSLFTLAPRATEITMVKPLMPIVLDDDAIGSASHFCEIDHV